MPSGPRYRRVLLKLSGEGLMGNREYGLDPAMVSMVAQEVKAVHSMGVQVCLVIGGGNIFRGVSAAASGMDPKPAVPVLLELFTSEGCSSCPAAEKWRARLQQ